MEPHRAQAAQQAENQAGGTAGKPPAAVAPKAERRALGSLRSNASRPQQPAGDDAPELCSAPPASFAVSSLPRDPYFRVHSRRRRAEAAAFLCAGGELALALARADDAEAAAGAALGPGAALLPRALRAGTAAASALGSAAYSSLSDGALERCSLLALLGGSGAGAVGEEEEEDALLRLCGSGLLEPLGDGATAALLQLTLGSLAAAE